MYLVTSATGFEMQPFEAACLSVDRVQRLVTGIGPVEAAVRLFSRLHDHTGQVKGIINFGVAGAYIQSAGRKGPQLLDICLAEKEVFGDLGICLENHVERFTGKELNVPDSFIMDKGLHEQAGTVLDSLDIPYYSGTFVTVNCASGTAVRGTLLAEQYNGICENMEGAAVVRVCNEFSLPCLEVRCISNLVEDRDLNRWKLRKACRRSGEVTAQIVDYLLNRLSAVPGNV